MFNWLFKDGGSAAVTYLDLNIMMTYGAYGLAIAQIPFMYNFFASIWTGKKIKNCESLWFGRPLVTTPAGSASMPVATAEDQMSIVQVCENDRQTINAIDELAGSPRLLEELKRRAFETGRSLFSDQHAYRELKAVIKTSVSA